MKHRLVSHSLPLLALFLALVPNALASSTWYVDGVNGGDNNNCKTPQTACKTIGHAISLASSGDSIMVAAATYKENLTIRIGLKVIGSGATTTIIDGSCVNRVLTISSPSANVTLSKFTIQNGCGSEGGGIYNKGTLTINDSTVSGNRAGTGKTRGYAGGIENNGALTISNCTVSGNDATGGFFGVPGRGGGVGNSGRLTITNSTISGNQVGGMEGRAGGIYNCCFTPVTVSNSTLGGNSAGVSGVGGGIYGSATLQNSIVANNSGGNCKGTMTSKGYNLSSDNTCNFNDTGDLNNTDPKLGQLGTYGGPTQTIPLLSGSPAIDAGNPSGCTDGKGHLLKTDQRGKPRPDKEDTGGCDMGAYERQKD
jgi:hypothetical protein